MTEGLPWRVTESHGELLIVGANDPALLDAWTRSDECTPPEPVPNPLELDMPMGLRPSPAITLR